MLNHRQFIYYRYVEVPVYIIISLHLKIHELTQKTYLIINEFEFREGQTKSKVAL